MSGTTTTVEIRTGAKTIRPAFKLADVDTLMIYATDMRRLLYKGCLPEIRGSIRSFMKQLVVKDRESDLYLLFYLP